MTVSRRRILQSAALALRELRAVVGQALRTHPAEGCPQSAMVCQLEDRILLSAAPVVSLDLSAASGAPSELPSGVTRSLVDAAPVISTEFVNATSQAPQTDLPGGDCAVPRTELLFVDSSLYGSEEFLEEVARFGDPFEVFVLDPKRNGIEQIASILQDYQGVTAVHLLTHGTQDAIRLGDVWLQSTNVQNYATAFEAWGASLGSDADLLVYACNVAAGSAGQSLIDQLAVRVGADVSASTNQTGSEELGGDWTLEYQTGSIETTAVVSASFQEQWHDLLGVITVTTSDDVVDGVTTSVASLLGNVGADGLISLREAIIATNNSAGDDTIFLPAGVFSLTRTGVNEEAGVWGDLDVTGTLTINGAGTGVSIIDGNGIDRVMHVLSGGSATLTDLTLRGGVVPLNNQGGGLLVDESATATLSRVEIRDNLAWRGGGIFNQGTLAARDVMIHSNTATETGAGLYNEGGVVELTRVAIHTNSAAVDGGGIYNVGQGATVQLINTTISGNSAAVNGGGVYNQRDMLATNVTIAHNSASAGDGVFGQGAVASFTLENSLLHNPAGENANATLTSLGHNLDSDGTAGLSEGTDVNLVDPRLNPTLSFAGGLVPVHELLNGSPAIDAGTGSGAASIDARGYARTDGLTDIGAYEVNAVVLRKVYWADQTNNTIQCSNLDGSLVETVLSGAEGLSYPSWLIVDSAQGKLYWTESSSGAVRRSNLDGTAVETLYSGLVGPSGLALDSNTGLLYWTENPASSPNQIRRADCNGGGTIENIVTTGSDDPVELTLDLEAGKVYWTDGNAGEIRRANLDGSGQEVFLAGVTKPQGLELDPYARNLYWTSDGLTSDRIQRANLDEVPIIEDLVTTGLSAPMGLALDLAVGSIYWTDSGTNKLQSSNLDGSGVRDVIVSGLNLPIGIAIGAAGPNVAPVITSNGGGATATINVAENATSVTTVNATDGDLPAQVLTYSIVGGADATRFTMDGSTGALTFVAAPDYEAPSDIGANNVYEVIVQVSDGALTDSQSIAVTVTAANDNSPVITSNGGGATATINVAENAASVTTVTATDSDLPAQVLTYSIVGGADATRFTIDGSTGALTFVTAPDYEAPSDIGANNVYEVIVQVSDGALTDSQLIAVTVTAANDNSPVITSNGGGATATINVAENATSVTTVTATDSDLPTQVLTYSIVGGADATRFTMDGSTGALTFVTAPDYEAPSDVGANNVYDVIVQVSDGAVTDSQSIAVTVTAANDNSPVITSNGGGATATINVAENATSVTTVTATDSDLPAQVLTYSIVGGADATRFTMDGSTGALTFVAAPDYEAPSDIGANNVYEVIVQVSDGAVTDSQSIAVTVTAANDNSPVITSNGGGATATINVAENATSVTTVTATDSDLPAQVLTYSIVGGADATRFTMDGSTGALTFVAAPDYEAPSDVGANNVYEVIVQVSDGAVTDSQSIAVTVTAANDNSPVITSNGGGATATINVAENATSVTTVTATDSDLPAQVLTYSIAGGADATRFTMDGSTGALTFVAAPDYEAPSDIGANNVYEVIVQVSDGAVTDSQSIAVTVTAANDNSPVITSNGGGATATINVAENATSVTTVTATDSDLPAQVLTYSIVGGADATRFTMDGSTGALTFVAAPDYEAPSDVGANNVYEVIVQVSDGAVTDSQSIAVTVTAANDNSPVITSNGGGATATINVAENATSVTTVTATDSDLPAQVLTYSIAGGADATRFTMDGSTGALTFVTAPDYEAPSDVGANNVYEVIVQVSDGALTDSQSIAVTVTAANDNNPVITSNGGGATATINVAENAASVTTVNATDGDLPAQVLTYSIAGGADVTRFTIDGSTGALTFVTAPDYEAPSDVGANNVYEVIVQVSDGAVTDSQSIAVTVTAANDNSPVITSNGGGATATINVAENATAVTTVLASDADRPMETLTYWIVGGADATQFAINNSTGALRFLAAPQYELPLDADGDNSYEVVIAAGDGLTTDVQSMSISVSDSAALPVALDDIVEEPTFIYVLPANQSGHDSVVSEDAAETEENDPTESADVEGSSMAGDAVNTNAGRLTFATTAVAGQTDSTSLSMWTGDTSEQGGGEGDDNRSAMELAELRIAATQSAKVGNGVPRRVSGDVESSTERDRSSESGAEDHGLQLFSHLGQSGQLWKELDEFHESVATPLRFREVAVGSVGVVASGFTVGYVIWILRSGLLLSSVLSLMPAWTFFDPLAVAWAEDDADDAPESDESLEELVESASQKVSERALIGSVSDPVESGGGRPQPGNEW